MNKNSIKAGALLAILAVALGAFGAHGLKGKISPEQINTFEIAVRYHYYHTFGIFIAILLAQNKPHRLLNYAVWFFVIGIVCFSGSLYLLSCRELLGLNSWKWLGPITPIGGLLFMIGWALILFSTIIKQK